LLAVACAYAWMAYNLPVRNIPGSVGLSFVPLLLAGLLAFLTLLLLLQGLLRGSGSPPDAGMPGWARAGAVVGLMLLYICILALTRIGFLMATPPYLALTMWQCGDRRPGFIVSTAVGVTFAIWVTFATLFAVPLPRGPLF
jgi:cytochrome b561